MFGCVLEESPPSKKEEWKRAWVGRFYLQITNAKEPMALHEMREQVSKLGRVVDSGCGTASDPEAGWLEVVVCAEDTASFIVQLDGLDVKDRVEKCIEVAFGEGRVQSKQLDLL
jgi:hypothetical protein